MARARSPRLGAFGAAVGSLAVCCGLAGTGLAGTGLGRAAPAARGGGAGGPGGVRGGLASPQPGGPPSGGPGPGGAQPGGLAGGGLDEASSTNWSGYAATGGAFHRVAARWVQPRAACAGGGSRFSSFWVGLDGYASDTVEQIGSEVDCARGRAVYYSWYEMYPDYPVFFRDPVRPGDRFAASVTYRGGHRYTLDLADLTRRWRRVVTARMAGTANSSAEVIAEAPSSAGGVLPLADFAAVRFTGAYVDRTPLGAHRPVRIVMVTGAGLPKTAVSPLTTGGRDFAVAWRRPG